MDISQHSHWKTVSSSCSVVAALWTPGYCEEVPDVIPGEFLCCICEQWEELSPVHRHNLPHLATLIHPGNELLDHTGHP